MKITTAYSQSMAVIDTAWSGSSIASVPLLRRNTPQDPPVGSPWVETDIVWGAGEIQSTDSNKLNGMWTFNIFTSKNIGTVSSSLIADAIQDMVVSMSISGLRVGAPGGPTPVPTDGKWFIRNLSCPFNMDANT